MRTLLGLVVALLAAQACGGRDADDQGLRTQRSTRLLDELLDDPRRAPPTPPAGTPIVATQVTRTPAAFRIRILGTADTRLRNEPALPLSPTGEAAPPDFWLLVTSGDGGTLYWRPLPDMRRGFGEWIEDERTGALRGEEFETEEGLISVRMPFFPEGSIDLYPGRGTPQERHTPVASLALVDRPPPAPATTIWRSP